MNKRILGIAVVAIIVVAVVTSLIIFMGGNKEKSLDLNKVTENILNLKDGKFNINAVDYMSLDVFTNIEGLYEYDFKEVLGLDSMLVEKYNVQYDKENKEIIAIFKPYEGKEAEVKNQLDKFMKEINAEMAEHEGYLIYVSSKDNAKVITEAKNGQNRIFPGMMPVNDEQLQNVLGITKDDVKEFSMQMPAMMTNSATFIIVKPAEGKEEYVKEKLDAYMLKLEQQWATYLPAQYELVKNRLTENYGGYYIYIVSNNNNVVLETIKNN